MRKRIIAVAVLAAVLAISMFGVPLAAGVAYYYLVDERNELERLADTAAIDTAADLVQGREATALPAVESGTSLALYDVTGHRSAGQGPSTADSPVSGALHDNAVHHDMTDGLLVVAVPVADGDHVTGVVRAAVPQSEMYPRIMITWLAMISLGMVAVLVTWLIARRHARRLAVPLERLAAAARHLGDGDFTVRTTPAGIKEIDAAAQALNRTAGRLGELVDRERAFSADASHQLRTPLAGLRLRLEAALGHDTDRQHDAIQDAIADTDRLERTIDDLLALARDVPRSESPLDPAGMVEELRLQWHGRLAALGRPLRLATDRDLPDSHVSPTAVRQVLAVLMDNALHHGVGTVTVHVRDAGETIAIDVGDEGNGLSSAEPELFARRAPGARGHGIGLALARSLAEAEGGRLRLTRRQPTTFTLFLPGDHHAATASP
jgi:signal transduction histidine kinase